MENDQDTEYLWQLVQEIHRRMDNDDRFKEIFATQQFDLEYRVTDPDLVFTVQIDHGKVSALRAESEAPAIVVETNGVYFHKMCSGTIVVPLAVLRKRIKMTLKNREKAAGAFPLTAVTRRIYNEVYGEFKAAGKWVPA